MDSDPEVSMQSGGTEATLSVVMASRERGDGAIVFHPVFDHEVCRLGPGSKRREIGEKTEQRFGQSV